MAFFFLFKLKIFSIYVNVITKLGFKKKLILFINGRWCLLIKIDPKLTYQCRTIQRQHSLRYIDMCSFLLCWYRQRSYHRRSIWSHCTHQHLQKLVIFNKWMIWNSQRSLYFTGGRFVVEKRKVEDIFLVKGSS